MDRIEKVVEVDGKKISVEMGHLAKQANGSCLVKIGDTTILATVVAGKEPKEDIDFMPLTVDYRERTYAAGKIPGGFFKREGKPRDKEVLTSRIIDRSIRPLFPENWRMPTQANSVVLSSDGENEADMISLLGVSIALQTSSIPFGGPIAAVKVGRVEGKFVINPTLQEQEKSDLDLIVSGTSDAIAMVEAGANELTEEVMIEALEKAHEEIKKLCELQKTFKQKEKTQVTPVEIEDSLKNKVTELCEKKIEEIVKINEKIQRDDASQALVKDILEKLKDEFPEKEKLIKYIYEEIFYQKARSLILDQKIRSDGRKYDEIRQIECNTGVLPRTHGSAIFTRGQTQALVTTTLGTPDDMQIMDELTGEYKERFLLHYNFPGFATGEPRPERGPGRREVGHGALARRALKNLLPPEENFPYTIRIVSDILESNGSSSMASVCGGSLALFDAGVNLKSSCAGIAMGLVKECDKYAILTDILGMEDHLGDMDFKVAGTRSGITALQMDIKISGLSKELMKEALEKAKVARMKILDKMEEAMATPRNDLSMYAPRMVVVQIPQKKIGELIGPGGKNIKKIQEETQAEINIEDDGRVFISSVDKNAVEKAQEMVEYHTAEVEVGKTYTGKVTRILNFGAFVEILPGKEGLIHISQLANEHVKKVTDVVSEGDIVEVKVIEIDNQNRINLSRKAVLNNK